jgi:GNAT superfamily N-acetyltransferase
LEIRKASSAGDYATARALFEEYAADIQLDLCFQNFSAELVTLSSMYGAPHGALLLAEVDETTAGCVGVRRFRGDVCEMKRLYLRPAFRGRHLGHELAAAIVGVARDLGYRAMVLDTLASMEPANCLYRSMGFQPADAYYANPLPDVRYFVLQL